jgi:23S rRNA G2069 N7-methylase RlmK/C1962 C5-methylase RlmI
MIWFINKKSATSSGRRHTADVTLPDLLRRAQAERLTVFPKTGTTAWRVCDAAAGAPCTVDWYDGAAVAYEKAGAGAPPDAAEVADGLGIASGMVFIKERRRQSDRQHGGQYQPLARAGAERTVREGFLAFSVNLSDYLDTGLFLDHRRLRLRLRAAARGKRVLNLFAYTGAFTVHAAAGDAASTTTVDLSNTYLRWAERNLALNRLDDPRNRLIKADCIKWLGEAHRPGWDLIICDPPTFSNSKAMAKSWEVERDQDWLLWRLWNLLTPGGSAWFSTNKAKFALSSKLPPFASVTDVTEETIDGDFAGTIPHRCWRLVR